MTALEPRDQLRLRIPDEPVDMGSRLRQAVLDGTRGPEGASDEICLGVWLWDQWRPSLEPAGIDRESFLDVVVSYRRELWFWLMGERGWEPVVTGLVGRLSRRIPVA